MNKEKIKTFVKENKKELLIGVGVLVTGITGVIIASKWCDKAIASIDVAEEIGKIRMKDKDVDALLTFIEVADQVKGSSKHYISFDAEEFTRLTGKNIITDNAGVEAIVKGGIIFCDLKE